MFVLISQHLAPAPTASPGPALSKRAWALLALAASALALAFVCLSAVGAQPGASEVELEHNVKAAFLYKFLGYVEYPEAAFPDAGEPLAIGVLGAGEVADELSRITTGRSMNGRAVVVRRLHPGEATGKIHLLFIGDEDGVNSDRALAAVRQLPVLTVTETERGLRQGSVINFRVVDQRVRFEVSLDAAETSNLKLSSRLLAVALKVQRTPH